MSFVALQQTSPKRWHYNGQHIAGLVELIRIGLTQRYQVTSETTQLHFGSLDAAQTWLQENDQKENRSVQHA